MHEAAFIGGASAIAYLFPGQGSQAIGMAQDVAALYPAARAALEEADDTLGFALSRLMAEGPEESLTDTINAQPALLAASIALARALDSELGSDYGAGGSGVYVAGHSMGEYSALVAAGALGYQDGLKLVRERGGLMKEAGTRAPGMMAAVLGLDEAKVAEVCANVAAQGGVVQVANDNCPGQVVISGDRQGMEAAMAALAQAGARKVTPLAVSIAAHSPLMQPAAEELQAAIAATPMRVPVVPVIGNTTAQPLRTVDAIRAELGAQLTGSVRWTASMQMAVAAGVSDFVEIGPGEVLVGLMKRVERNAGRHSVNSVETIQETAAWLRSRK